MESEDSSGATGTDNTGAMVAPPRPLRGPILYSDSQSQSISHLHEQDSVGEEEDGEDADDEGPSSATQRPRARRLPSFLKHWFFAGGYQWDWALVVALFLTSAIPQRLVLPVDRHITPADPALSYPYTQGTVSSEVLYACVIMGPLLLFSLAQVWVRSSEDWHNGILSLGEALSISFNIKRWLNLVGRQRPDWFARLEAGEGPAGGVVSYPSGHAAYSFCAATVMALYIWGKLRVFSRTEKGSFSKLLAGMLPLAGAAFIAATRLTDYRHSFSDVNAGSAIGICCGLMAYLLNFPCLTSSDCHIGRSRTRFHTASYLEYGTSEELSDVTEVASQIGPSHPSVSHRIARNSAQNGQNAIS